MSKGEVMANFFQEYIKKLKTNLTQIDTQKFKEFVDILLRAREENKQIFILGNGGSAATSSHFACDLGKGTITDFEKQKRFRVISITDNISTISAIGNDLSYDDIFIEQIKNLLNPGDIVIGISASGNSTNVIKALEYANNLGAFTAGLIGFSGGKMKNIVDFSIISKEENYGIAEDIHLIIVHMVTQYIKEIISKEL